MICSIVTEDFPVNQPELCVTFTTVSITDYNNSNKESQANKTEESMQEAINNENKGKECLEQVVAPKEITAEQTVDKDNEENKRRKEI